MAPVFTFVFLYFISGRIKTYRFNYKEIYDGIKNVHFFGAIIVHETRGGKLTSYRNIEVIDGQQRLTTM